MGKNKYESLIRSIELSNIELQDLSCQRNNNLSSEKKSNLQVGLQHEIVEQFYDSLDYVVHTHFNVSAFHGEEDDKELAEHSINNENTLFTINFTLESTYKVDIANIDHDLEAYKEEFKLFSKRNVPINIWPYAREIISSITTRMGFPPLIIPTNKNVTPF